MKSTTAAQATRERRHFAAAVLACAAMAMVSPSVSHAEPAPVAPGLWEVQMLALFQPDPQPGANHWPGMPGKQRARTYRICLDAPRARAPMSMPQWSGAAQRVSDDMSVMVRENAAGSGRTAPAGEWLYRRLSDREFEGSQSLSGDAGVEMTLQYRSVYVQRDCGGLAPTPMSSFGEP